MLPKTIKAIGAIFIIGGIIRITYISYYYFRDEATDYIFFLYLLFFGFSVISGIILFLNQKYGIYLTLINGLLQILYFSISGVVYFYSVLFTFLIYFEKGFKIKFIIQMGSALSVAYLPNEGKGMFELGVNIVPILFTLIILNYMKNSRDRDIMIKKQDDNAL